MPSEVSRDRPPGRAPRGTALGFGIIMLFWAGIPAAAIIALSPYVGDPVSVIVRAIFAPFVSLIVLLPLIVGFTRRRYWGVLAYFWCGTIAVAMPFVALAAIGAMLVGSASHPPATIGLSYVFGAPILASLLLVPWLLRALRLRYWQPWTEPSEWEVGDETTPRWLFRAAGVTPPDPAVRADKTARRR